ncbi:MAG: hypothetical protein AB7E30_09865 [Lawsonibacter sp.]
MKRNRHRLRPALGGLLLPVGALAVLLCFFAALSNFDDGQNEEGRQQLEDSLRRASVACYAVEGIYPPDLDYLEAHYGLQIDTDRYTVFYDIFGSNLMPDITVLEKET